MAPWNSLARAQEEVGGEGAWTRTLMGSAEGHQCTALGTTTVWCRPRRRGSELLLQMVSMLMPNLLAILCCYREHDSLLHVACLTNSA